MSDLPEMYAYDFADGTSIQEILGACAEAATEVWNGQTEADYREDGTPFISFYGEQDGESVLFSSYDLMIAPMDDRTRLVTVQQYDMGGFDPSGWSMHSNAAAKLDPSGGRALDGEAAQQAYGKCDGRFAKAT